jgi:hypothetical protein
VGFGSRHWSVPIQTPPPTSQKNWAMFVSFFSVVGFGTRRWSVPI